MRDHARERFALIGNVVYLNVVAVRKASAMTASQCPSVKYAKKNTARIVPLKSGNVLAGAGVFVACVSQTLLVALGACKLSAVTAIPTISHNVMAVTS